MKSHLIELTIIKELYNFGWVNVKTLKNDILPKEFMYCS